MSQIVPGPLGLRVIRKANSWVKKGHLGFQWLVARFAPFFTTEAQGCYVDPDGFEALLTVHHFEKIPRVSGTARFLISVTNHGNQGWTEADAPRLSLRWLTREAGKAEVVLCESVPLDLPTLAPGNRRILRGEVAVPINSVLDVTVEWNLRREGGPWLADPTGPARLFRHVSGQNALGAPVDFDYEIIYRKFDLEKDYWTVVGPATREDYEKLGQGNCDTLVQMGLTACSRVLDVGCGTGQLTGPLTRVIGPEGVYYGTDVSATAIEFCQRKFPLPHFHFLKNEQSSIPVEGIPFDIIYLGSVVTHMYPDDIEAMLVHLRRLVAPAGFVLVDAFVSPEIPGFVGSRAMIQLNETWLQQSFRNRGFHFAETTSLSWNEHCRRVIYKLTPVEAPSRLE